MAGAKIMRPRVYRITLTQLTILLPLCLALVFVDQVWAYCVLSGGLIAALPQAYFAARVFRWSGAQSAQAVAQSSYRGLVGKFIFSAAGFAVVFALVRPIEGLAVFAGYFIMLAVQIIGTWVLLRDPKVEHTDTNR